MRALLDVNVLVALFDQEHGFNERAHVWLEKACDAGIATCPLTENGLVRIVSHPNYSNKLRFSPDLVVQGLRRFVKTADHAFWPDDITLRDAAAIDAERILGSRQITDLYLLALAVRHGGRLVTFDEGINLAAVPAARPTNLCII
jgi:toxin-antitoxin system PIN domain toxin